MTSLTGASKRSRFAAAGGRRVTSCSLPPRISRLQWSFATPLSGECHARAVRPPEFSRPVRPYRQLAGQVPRFPVHVRLTTPVGHERRSRTNSIRASDRGHSPLQSVVRERRLAQSCRLRGPESPAGRATGPDRRPRRVSEYGLLASCTTARLSTTSSTTTSRAGRYGFPTGFRTRRSIASAPHARNAVLLLDLEACDLGYSPTV